MSEWHISVIREGHGLSIGAHTMVEADREEDDLYQEAAAHAKTILAKGLLFEIAITTNLLLKAPSPPVLLGWICTHEMQTKRYVISAPGYIPWRGVTVLGGERV